MRRPPGSPWCDTPNRQTNGVYFVLAVGGVNGGMSYITSRYDVEFLTVCDAEWNSVVFKEALHIRVILEGGCLTRYSRFDRSHYEAYRLAVSM
jgi:hypothetical protein